MRSCPTDSRFATATKRACTHGQGPWQVACAPADVRPRQGVRALHPARHEEQTPSSVFGHGEAPAALLDSDGRSFGRVRGPAAAAAVTLAGSGRPCGRAALWRQARARAAVSEDGTVGRPGWSRRLAGSLAGARRRLGDVCGGRAVHVPGLRDGARCHGRGPGSPRAPSSAGPEMRLWLWTFAVGGRRRRRRRPRRRPFSGASG